MFSFVSQKFQRVSLNICLFSGSKGCFVGVMINTVKASNFGPHENFRLFLASPVASVDESCTKK
jgi:hypothetical protein